MTDPLFHVAIRSEWEEARTSGAYRRSSLGRSLDEEGFIHCSTLSQLAETGRRHYGDVTDDLAVLVIDPERLSADVRYEHAPNGSGPFPHVYGPIDVDAVVDIVPATAGAGTFVVRWPHEP